MGIENLDDSQIDFQSGFDSSKPPSHPKIPPHIPFGYHPTSSQGSPRQYPQRSPRKSPRINMANVPRISWLAPGSISLLGALHDLPKHSKKFLLKFHPNNKASPEDHVSKFMLAVSLMNVQNEDVVCRLFPYMFEGKSYMWYCALPQGSITN